MFTMSQLVLHIGTVCEATGNLFLYSNVCDTLFFDLNFFARLYFRLKIGIALDKSEAIRFRMRMADDVSTGVSSSG